MTSAIGQALRAGLAALLAWLVILPFGGFADQYPYYAPMGALIAVTGSIVASFRQSLQAVAGMALGAGLATASSPLPEALAILAVVGLGSALSQWRWFGWYALYVPLTGLFVLIIGAGDPVQFAIAYITLFTVGAVAGFGVVALAPPLPLRDVDWTIATLRDRLADQLDHLAEGLDWTRPPTPGEWEERQHDLEPLVAQMRDVVEQATAARRVNWRARRWREAADRQYHSARTLSRLTHLVEDLTVLLVDEERADLDEVVLGPALRPTAAPAIRDAAAVLRSLRDAEPEQEPRARARRSLEAFVVAIREHREYSESELLSASSIAAELRRFLDTAAPTPTPLAVHSNLRLRLRR